ncbi:MAG: 2Fe-2S iron-sulfur cluster-binding protein [Leptospiraceae bacterium]|nr:2Fe-2S iron-sulfur cluster-binding protein [Leptospiraceae bacterium]
MVEIFVDGLKLEVDEKKNLIDALKEKGIHVPHFCYHPALEVVGMCRICLIEVGSVKIDPQTKEPARDDKGQVVVQWNPKFQAACNTPITAGMHIRVASEKVKKAREGVMEFLLINHPLDCPVCDKAGECSLQDYSFAVGNETTRYREVKRNIPQEKIGTNLLINHNRCILCYRCVRFDRDIVGIHDLEMQARGNDTVIAYTPPPGSRDTLLNHNYQGALADICPVGALLNENTLFRSRVWWYQQNQSICHGCSTLCRVTTNVKNNEIYRYMPPEEPEKNGFFICDKGRFSTTDFSRDRLLTYLIKGHGSKSRDVLPQLADLFHQAHSLLLVGGTTESCEDIDRILSLVQKWQAKGKQVNWEYRTQPYMWRGEWDKKVDFLLMVDQRPNSNYLRQKISGFTSQEKWQEALQEADLIIVINEFAAPYSYRIENYADIEKLYLFKLFEEKSLWSKTVLLNTHANAATAKALASLPIMVFPEKAGTYIDKEGVAKKSAQSLTPAQGLLSSGQILAKWNDYVEQDSLAYV